LNIGQTLVLQTFLCAAVVLGTNVDAEEIDLQRLSIKENTIMFYYKDLSEVVPFYEETLGLTKTFDQDWIKIYQLTTTSYVGLVQEGDESFHRAQENNAVMLSFVTDQVDAWYEQLKRVQGTVFLKDIYNNEHVPIRAFLVADPGGYSIEFFQWLDAEQ